MEKLSRSQSAPLGGVVLSVLLATVPAHAMVVVKRDFPELVGRAEQIVVGSVSDLKEVPDESGVPFTFVTFSDLTVLKGDVGATLTLRFYGGSADDVAVHVPDMPSFALGERALLFVVGNGRDVCPLVGVWQGRFRVRFDPARGTDVVEDNDGRPVVAVEGRRAERRAEAGNRTPLTLDEFRRLVADELAHPTISGEIR